MRRWIPKPIDIGSGSVMGMILGISIALYHYEYTSYLAQWVCIVSILGIVFQMSKSYYEQRTEPIRTKIAYLMGMSMVVTVSLGMGYIRADTVINSYHEERPFYYGTQGIYHIQVTGSPQETMTVDGLMTVVDGTVEGLAIDKENNSETLPASGNIRVYVRGRPSIHIGERYRIEGVVKGFTYYEQSGAISMKTRHINDSLVGTLYDGQIVGSYRITPTRWGHIKDSIFVIWNTMDEIHHWIAKQFEEHLDPSIATLGASLVLGGQYVTLPEATVKLFSETGLIHILSVSGSHIALLFLIISFIVKPFCKSKRTEFLVTTSMILVYCTIVGWSPPVLRAAMMGILAGYVALHGGTYRAIQGLVLSAVCLLLWKPLYAVDISFILSFGSTLGIIGLYPYVYRIFPPSTISKAIALCISAQVLIFPVELYYFYNVSFLSILSNLIVGPLLDMAIIIGLLLSVLNSIVVCTWGWWVLGFILKASVALLVAIRDLGVLWSPPMPIWLVLLWYMGLSYVYWLLALKEPIHLRWNRMASVGLLALGVLPLMISYTMTTIHIVPIALHSGPACMVYKTGLHREAYLYIDAKNGDISQRDMKQCVNVLHHNGFQQWNSLFVDAYQNGSVHIDTLRAYYVKEEQKEGIQSNWLVVSAHKKDGYEIIVKGNRIFHLNPRKEEEKSTEIVYNTKSEANTIYGLTSTERLLEYQQKGAKQFVVWNTLHSRFDVEEGVYIVGSDEDNMFTL